MAIEIEEDGLISVGAYEQGVQVSEIDEDKARAWVANESSFWRSFFLDDLLIQMNGRAFKVESPSEKYINYWELIGAPENGEVFFSNLRSAIDNAKSLRIILSEGIIAKTALDSLSNKRYSEDGHEYIQSINFEDAYLALICYSQEIYAAETQGRQAVQAAQLERAMAVVRFHPAANHMLSRARLDETLSLARTQEKQSRDFLVEARGELGVRLERIRNLEETYGEKLRLEAPATYWEAVGREARNRSWMWLAGFCAAVAVPVGATICLWSPFSAALATFLGEAGIGGGVLISFFALAYGWFLKHLSRGFVQNLQIADDAHQRRVMVMTYLGLAKESSTEISSNERALILNALFRPVPPSTADDGPPAGLIDLINKRG